MALVRYPLHEPRRDVSARATRLWVVGTAESLSRSLRRRLLGRLRAVQPYELGVELMPLEGSAGGDSVWGRELAEAIPRPVRPGADGTAEVALGIELAEAMRPAASACSSLPAKIEASRMRTTLRGWPSKRSLSMRSRPSCRKARSAPTWRTEYPRALRRAPHWSLTRSYSSSAKAMNSSTRRRRCSSRRRAIIDGRSLAVELGVDVEEVPDPQQRLAGHGALARAASQYLRRAAPAADLGALMAIAVVVITRMAECVVDAGRVRLDVPLKALNIGRTTWLVYWSWNSKRMWLRSAILTT